jgi:hypothetical protein
MLTDSKDIILFLISSETGKQDKCKEYISGYISFAIGYILDR